MAEKKVRCIAEVYAELDVLQRELWRAAIGKPSALAALQERAVQQLKIALEENITLRAQLEEAKKHVLVAEKGKELYYELQELDCNVRAIDQKRRAFKEALEEAEIWKNA